MISFNIRYGTENIICIGHLVAEVINVKVREINNSENSIICVSSLYYFQVIDTLLKNNICIVELIVQGTESGMH